MQPFPQGDVPFGQANALLLLLGASVVLGRHAPMRVAMSASPARPRMPLFVRIAVGFFMIYQSRPETPLPQSTRARSDRWCVDVIVFPACIPCPGAAHADTVLPWCE